jgi:toxin ParE1/3/4
MSVRVLQRARARQDILEIISYIASDNPGAAAALYEAYERILQHLKETPEMGRPYAPGDPQLGQVRAVAIGRFRRYLVFYRRQDDNVEVLRVLHAHRDITSILSDDSG